MGQTGGGSDGGRPRTRRLTGLRSLFSRPSSAVGAVMVAVFILFAVFGPWIAPYSATQQIPADAREGLSAQHFFGTDHLGRDVFSRVVLGTGSVVGLAGLGTALAVVAGTLVGLVSGYRGGWLDEVLMRLFDSFLAIPALLLALLFLGALGPTRSGVALVLLVVYMPIVARVVRSQVLATKPKAFVEMARLQGEPTPRILLREILPSALPALSVEAALRFSYAIFLVASLGFLGVGVGPPSPNWGLMVSEARHYATLTPWALFFPAGAIALLVVGVNLTADSLKQALLEPGRARGRPAVATAAPEDLWSADYEPEDALLSVRGLTVEYAQGSKWHGAVRDVNLDVRAGEVCALVGESGSGKTTLALALLRHLSPGGRIRTGVADLGGDDVLRLSGEELRRLRGRRVALVPQDPQVSLNPSLRIGEQMGEQIRVHQGVGRRAARRRVRELLSDVDISDPGRVARSYPHQLSGGMQQRVMVAMALSADPELLILDEPTTGLDVTTQAVVLDFLRSVVARRGAAALYITHNLGVVAQIAQRVTVLYAGELVEDAPVEDLFARPLHPYTHGLMAGVPRLGEAGREVALAAMPGRIPTLGEYADQCVFAPRCPLAVDLCRARRPQLEQAAAGRWVRCVRW
ncbi:MAG: dipeptide/oligopeptide/nickel ABC transporter permease/ATP-binding protein, partial [Candidatus Bipolaricaulota bacterium]